MFGADGGPWSFGKQIPPQFSLVEKLELPDDLKRKLCSENARALFMLD
jgi:predicted TIM-barrel fold metal-dependent hydrolase